MALAGHGRQWHGLLLLVRGHEGRAPPSARRALLRAVSLLRLMRCRRRLLLSGVDLCLHHRCLRLLLLLLHCLRMREGMCQKQGFRSMTKTFTDSACKQWKIARLLSTWVWDGMCKNSGLKIFLKP